MKAYNQFLKTFCLISKFILRLAFRNGELVSDLLKLSLSLIFNPLLPGVAFIYPPENIRKPTVFGEFKKGTPGCNVLKVREWEWIFNRFFVDYMPFLNSFPRTLFQKTSAVFK